MELSVMSSEEATKPLVCARDGGHTGSIRSAFQPTCPAAAPTLDCDCEGWTQVRTWRGSHDRAQGRDYPDARGPGGIRGLVRLPKHPRGPIRPRAMSDLEVIVGWVAEHHAEWAGKGHGPITRAYRLATAIGNPARDDWYELPVRERPSMSS
jgi:hypothetical protein